MVVQRSFLYEWRSYSPTKKILLTLAAVGFFAVAATSPYFIPKLIKAYFKDLSKRDIRQHANVVYTLKKQKDIVFKKDKAGNIIITLTDKGKKKVLSYNVESLRLKKEKDWDHQWRIMMYDISQLRKSQANALRKKIKKLGLYRIQKSVWIYPYPFEDEIQFLFTVYRIPLKEFLYFTTDHITNEKEVKRFFELL